RRTGRRTSPGCRSRKSDCRRGRMSGKTTGFRRPPSAEEETATGTEAAAVAAVSAAKNPARRTAPPEAIKETGTACRGLLLPSLTGSQEEGEDDEEEEEEEEVMIARMAAAAMVTPPWPSRTAGRGGLPPRTGTRRTRSTSERGSACRSLLRMAVVA
ncbi:unnamed protein product, partial [Laminaria digitata]